MKLEEATKLALQGKLTEDKDEIFNTVIQVNVDKLLNKLIKELKNRGSEIPDYSFSIGMGSYPVDTVILLSGPGVRYRNIKPSSSVYISCENLIDNKSDTLLSYDDIDNHKYFSSNIYNIDNFVDSVINTLKELKNSTQDN